MTDRVLLSSLRYAVALAQARMPDGGVSVSIAVSVEAAYQRYQEATDAVLPLRPWEAWKYVLPPFVNR